MTPDKRYNFITTTNPQFNNNPNPNFYPHNPTTTFPTTPITINPKRAGGGEREGTEGREGVRGSRKFSWSRDKMNKGCGHVLLAL